MNSCLYTGWVSHQRLTPKRHGFRYRLCLAYLDLNELAGMENARFGPLFIRRKDHLGDAKRPLQNSVREKIKQETGETSAGPIYLLTGFGFMWHRFNPVSFYFCYNNTGDQLEFIVAEVSNTPWREQHCYVLDARQQINHTDKTAQSLSFKSEKVFHVSPFMPMDMQYGWHIRPPAEKLSIAITNSKDGEPVFTAGLQMQRQPLSRWNLIKAFVQQPLMSLKVVAAIHWQALRLWLKSVPVYTHPAVLQGRSKERKENALEHR